MSGTYSPDEVEQFVQDYVEEWDWEQDRAHVQNTSKAVRRLVRAIVETGSIDDEAMRTVFNLCQNDQAFSPAKKKQRIEDLAIDGEAKTAIKKRIDDGTGIVGSGTYTVPIGGYEDEAFDLLATAVRSNDRDEIDAAIETFVSHDIGGVQAGIMSPILYFLHPTKYPISNDRSRAGMEEYFGFPLSRHLEDYLEDVEKFHVVRANYPFNDDFRHVDSFFNWIEAHEYYPQFSDSPIHSDHQRDSLDETSTADNESDTDRSSTAESSVQLADSDFYWVNQKRNVELEGGYLRSRDRKWQRDLTVLEPGDIVFHYTDQAIRACSVVTSEAYRTELEDGEEYYRVDVTATRLDDPLPLTEIQATLQDPEYRQEQTRYPLDKNGKVIQAYLCHLTPDAGAYILAEADVDPPEFEPGDETHSDPGLRDDTRPGTEPIDSDGVSQNAIDDLAAKLTTPEIDVSVPTGLYFEDADRLRREVEASLRSGKHIILTGPPGTGKTKLAKAICESATRSAPAQVDDYRFTTATSEWTAFDTIGGYVPSRGDGGQELLFEPRLFLKCFRQDSVVNEWLIIDEINRSDIDKAFGQLFSVLSGDSTELPYERDRTVELRSLTESTSRDELADIIANPDAFPVTPAWRLIATMNTYDKTSLYEMSYAFMRRFNFIHVGVPALTGEDGVRTSLLDPNDSDNYSTAWLTDDDALRPVLQDVYPELSVLWHHINEHRVIGPSIVYDIIRYLDSYDDSVQGYNEALTSAVISLVYPQLEGMRPEQQKQLVRSLTDTNVPTDTGRVSLGLDGAFLRRKASDFFGITFDDDA